ncbi:methyltransferase domain-containing protein [Candidatus Marithrix sp. Canyon 246]|uniref:methyltransferase domain-containing protein n=1 Tax=Candidatus Marithrix sp. Canyon 246 TaxID=1827136 RepID=UPI000849F627|nr:methyltransferase domain-containing protein [Candidatus Marithrix sp. Canyon 246]
MKNIAQIIGSKCRAKRIAPLREMIKKIYKKYGKVSIIDVGGTKVYWNFIGEQFLNEKNVKITLVNLPGTFINPKDDKIFIYIEADACDLSQFNDNSFNIAHSNSVIEHVGSWEQMQQCAKEIRRVGENYFVQAPYFWFPIEPHYMVPFIHWFSEQIRISLVMKFSIGHIEKAKNLNEAVNEVIHMNLPNQTMFNQLFQDAKIRKEKVFGLTKSLVAIKNVAYNV